MKQLIMKQGETSIRETVTVVNRKGKEEYTVLMSTKENTPKITIKTVGKDNCAVVSEIGVENSERYVIKVNGKEMFIIEKEIPTISSKYIVKSEVMFIEGDLCGMSFDIMLGYRKIAKIRERWVSMGDSYELTIFEPENEIALVALLAILDFVKYNTSKSE